MGATAKPGAQAPTAPDLRHKSLKLDLACGQQKREGFQGVDIAEGVADYTVDLESFPYPFEDSSVDEVFCAHYIEHARDAIAFMDEVHRILKPGASATIVAPYYTSMRAWQDPTHVRAISEKFFLYFNRQWRETNFLRHYPIKADFDIEKIELAYNPDFKIAPEKLEYARRHMWNVVNDIWVVLRALKA